MTGYIEGLRQMAGLDQPQRVAPSRTGQAEVWPPGRPDLVRFVPSVSAYRDVYWCPLITEPCFVVGGSHTNTPCCGGCGMDLSRPNHDHPFLAGFSLNATTAHVRPEAQA